MDVPLKDCLDVDSGEGSEDDVLPLPDEELKEVLMDYGDGDDEMEDAEAAEGEPADAESSAEAAQSSDSEF